MKLLYAEDEKQLSMAVAEILKMEGYEVDCVYDGVDAIDHIRGNIYDAAILDIMMPKMDGIEVLRTMREESDYTPVLMLTAKAAVNDRIEGLDTGADDYLGKPFDMKELLAHLNSMLRRSSKYRDRALVLGNVSLDCDTGEMKTDCASLRLSGRENALLSLFLKQPDIIITEERICLVIGEEESGAAALYVSYLKTKLLQIRADIEIITEDTGYKMRQCKLGG